jgi:hypothetical protein
MRASTEKILWTTATVTVVGALGYLLWIQGQKPVAAVPTYAPPTPALGSPVTVFQPGSNYSLAATAPAGVTDSATLAAKLSAAGWKSPNVTALIPGAGYTATGTWGGAANTPVPAGVIATLMA